MESFLRKILEQDIKDNSMTKDKKKKKIILCLSYKCICVISPN